MVDMIRKFLLNSCFLCGRQIRIPIDPGWKLVLDLLAHPPHVSSVVLRVAFDASASQLVGDCARVILRSALCETVDFRIAFAVVDLVAKAHRG